MFEDAGTMAAGSPAHLSDDDARRQHAFCGITESLIQSQPVSSLEDAAELLASTLEICVPGAGGFVTFLTDEGPTFQTFGAMKGRTGSPADRGRSRTLEVADRGVHLHGVLGPGAEACVPLVAPQTGAVYAILDASEMDSRELLIRLQFMAESSRCVFGTPTPASPFRREPAAGDDSLVHAKRSFERELIASRLSECGGNIAAAARSLNMDRGQLSRLVKRHEINKKSFKRSSD